MKLISSVYCDVLQHNSSVVIFSLKKIIVAAISTCVSMSHLTYLCVLCMCMCMTLLHHCMHDVQCLECHISLFYLNVYYVKIPFKL